MSANNAIIKWQPEHFTKGTIVQLIDYYLNEDKTVAHAPLFEGQEEAIVTVESIFKNGVDSWCIATNTYNNFTKTYEMFNFTHIGKIVKRANAPVVIKRNNNRPVENSKKYIDGNVYAKSQYVWVSMEEILSALFNKFKVYEKYSLNFDQNKFITEFQKQSFVKVKKQLGYFTVLKASKKKVDHWFKQNLNRFSITKKVAIAIEEKYTQEEYERDFRLDERFVEDESEFSTSDFESNSGI